MSNTAVYCYPETDSEPKIHLTSSWKAHNAINKPLDKIQDKDWQWSKIQYEIEVKDDPVNPSYHQMQE